MNQEEMKNEFQALYDKMANSNDVRYMRVFGDVHKEMMDWMIHNRPSDAQEWIERLSSINWKNFLTKRESEKIVSEMNPRSPLSFEVWRQSMKRHEFALDKPMFYNEYALWATMNMIMSDSSSTLERHVGSDNLFGVVYSLAIDHLTDLDGRFSIRGYFGV